MERKIEKYAAVHIYIYLEKETDREEGKERDRKRYKAITAAVSIHI